MRTQGLIRLFLAAWLQVVLISINTWQIAHGKLYGAMLVSLGIGLVWAHLVKVISASTILDRFVYAIGGSMGVASGIWLMALIY